jgi:UDP-N-acetylmuramyl pentapeptide phosphotransferase/UDP-N-acetylglucosamine-1-phosphate transferase
VQVLIVAFLVAFTITLWIVRLRHLHGRLTADSTQGVQKFHVGSVPRVGGVGLLGGMVAAWMVLLARGSNESSLMGMLLVAALPAFLMGLAEDISKKVGALPRLLATMVAAGLGAWWAGAVLPRLDVPGVDALLAWGPAATTFTVFAVAGVAHAVNIIDGFNGLASMVAALMLAALGYVAYLVEDALVWNMTLAGMGALWGFWLWNYPRGLIFLGDGGAYLAGFWFAEAAVLLVARNPQVSPWFGLLVGLYPVFETVFSMYRRRVLQRRSTGLPDALHLHSLIFRRLVRWAAGKQAARDLTRRNAATAPYLWCLAMVSIVPAVLFWRHTAVLVLFALAFILFYIWAYQRIVRFRTRDFRPWKKRP